LARGLKVCSIFDLEKKSGYGTISGFEMLVMGLRAFLEECMDDA
jgi:hypothetical protein